MKTPQEEKHPCMCDTCLSARDAEIKRVRGFLLTSLLEEMKKMKENHNGCDNQCDVCGECWKHKYETALSDIEQLIKSKL